MNDHRKKYQHNYRKSYKSKTKRVNLTLTNAEYRDFSREAKKSNTKPTTYIKSLALSGLKHQAVIPPNIETELKTLRFAIRNIANNVNQIAHYSNTVHNLTAEQEHGLLQHLKQLEEAVFQYTQGQIMNTKHDH